LATVLVVDDDVDLLRALRLALRADDHRVIAVPNAREALVEVIRSDVDVILADVVMPHMNGLELCTEVVGNRPDIPVVLMTGKGQLEMAIAAIRAGAHDFLLKPVVGPALLSAVARAARRRALLAPARPSSPIARAIELDGVIGDSPAMSRVVEVLIRAADSRVPVLVSGGPGTGKRRIARAVHDASRRRGLPFVSVRCGDLTGDSLFALFDRSAGGTLHLDEISELSAPLQSELARILQASPSPDDVRLVATTRHDLEARVEEDRFLAELFLRLDVVHVELPPLRARADDVLLLAHHLMGLFAAREQRSVRAISPAAAEKLLQYPWPGNVRELEDCMERAVALGRYDVIGVDDLPDRVRDPATPSSPVAAPLLTLEELERAHLRQVLASVDGNKTIAARILGIDRKTLYRKLDLLDPNR
jgi:DNA-binding NtrC family response regulator